MVNLFNHKKHIAIFALLILPFGNASAYVIDIYQSNPVAGIANLAAADTIISSGILKTTALTSIIEFDDLGDGSRGNFSIDNPFPGGFNDSFVAHVTGTFSIAAGGLQTLGINHDDGARLKIDGLSWAAADGVADNRNTQATFFLAAGLHTVDIVFFENNGGASLEFYREDAGVKTLVVPEPFTIALMGLGLLGLGLTRRRPYR